MSVGAEFWARDEPVPEEIQRLLGQLIAEATDASDVFNIYAAAGMPSLSLERLTPHQPVAHLRSSIKRLLVKHGYLPDKQPAAIKLVMEQMESMAPRYAEERECERG